MAIIATSTNTFGVKPSGYCDYCETHICGTTAAGTVCYGYWHEVEVE